MPSTATDAAGNRGEHAPAADSAAPARFGLTTATALIIGTIIGVGIFNLPTLLAAYGPISLVSMGRPRSERLPSRCCLRRCLGGCLQTSLASVH